MSDQKLNEILTVLTRVERKIDTNAAVMNQHVRDDEIVHAEVRALKRQRGFISTIVAIFVAVGAGLMYAVKRIFGH